MAKYAQEILKGLYIKVSQVSYYLRLKALINIYLGNSLKEYYTKYKAAAKQIKQLSKEIPYLNITYTRPI